MIEQFVNGFDIITEKFRVYPLTNQQPFLCRRKKELHPRSGKSINNDWFESRFKNLPIGPFTAVEWFDGNKHFFPCIEERSTDDWGGALRSYRHKVKFFPKNGRFEFDEEDHVTDGDFLILDENSKVKKTISRNKFFVMYDILMPYVIDR